MANPQCLLTEFGIYYRLKSGARLHPSKAFLGLQRKPGHTCEHEQSLGNANGISR